MTFRSRTLYQLSYNGKTRKTQFRRACQELNGDLPITDALPTELQRPCQETGPTKKPALSKLYEILWWTGEDSNLRSSQGATDLQSVAISRSATRPGHSPAKRPPKRGSHCGETISIQRKDRPPQHRLAPDRRVEPKRPLTQHPPRGQACLAPTPAILLIFAFRARYSAGQRRNLL